MPPRRAAPAAARSFRCRHACSTIPRKSRSRCSRSGLRQPDVRIPIASAASKARRLGPDLPGRHPQLTAFELAFWCSALRGSRSGPRPGMNRAATGPAARGARARHREIGAGNLDELAPARSAARGRGRRSSTRPSIAWPIGSSSRSADQRELLAGVSHELRSPLARIRLITELGATRTGRRSRSSTEIDGRSSRSTRWWASCSRAPASTSPRSSRSPSNARARHPRARTRQSACRASASAARRQRASRQSDAPVTSALEPARQCSAAWRWCDAARSVGRPDRRRVRGGGSGTRFCRAGFAARVRFVRAPRASGSPAAGRRSRTRPTSREPSLARPGIGAESGASRLAIRAVSGPRIAPKEAPGSVCASRGVLSKLHQRTRARKSRVRLAEPRLASQDAGARMAKSDDRAEKEGQAKGKKRRLLPKRRSRTLRPAGAQDAKSDRAVDVALDPLRRRHHLRLADARLIDRRSLLGDGFRFGSRYGDL